AHGSTLGCLARVACLAGAVFFANCAGAGDLSFGKLGEPVQLVVGYQPYYTEAWSGVVMRGKEFWKRYLPKGSTVEFQVGLQVAVPKGSCTDRFAQAVFKKEKVEPGAYLNQNIEVITSGFRAGKIDAAVVWEPTASRLVQEGLARRIASGASVGENDAAFLAMRRELIEQRPDIAKAWLNAELDAELFLADPKNAAEVTKLAAEQT